MAWHRAWLVTWDLGPGILIKCRDSAAQLYPGYIMPVTCSSQHSLSDTQLSSHSSFNFKEVLSCCHTFAEFFNVVQFMPEAIKLCLTLTRWFNNQRKTKHEAIVPSSSEWTFLLQQHRILLFFFFLGLIATLRGCGWCLNVLQRGSAHHYCLYRVSQMRSITLSRLISHNHTDSLDSSHVVLLMPMPELYYCYYCCVSVCYPVTHRPQVSNTPELYIGRSDATSSHWNVPRGLMILLFLTLSQVYCPLHSALACDGSENKLRETPRSEERGGGQAGHTGHPRQGRDGAQADGSP